jgi:protein-S-isoprenylcysteine O-methyltransferase Ste14
MRKGAAGCFWLRGHKHPPTCWNPEKNRINAISVQKGLGDRLVSSLNLWFLVAGYFVMVAFLTIQELLRKTPEAKTFQRGASEKGSMLLIGVTLGVGLWLPLIVDALGLAVFPIDIAEGTAALAVMLFGLGLRVWAAVTLGGYYTRTLMTTADHKVVTAGPYARVRHPAYLGVILLWSGFGVLSGDLVTASIFPVMLVVVYLYRISVEEKMLVRELGEDYVQYQRKTRKLIPAVY